LLIAVPLAGYGLAWFGHFAIERNRPLSLDKPLWSLRADIKMCGLMLRGKMAAEIARIEAQLAASSA
jgi:hypothetical protein